MNRFVRTLTLGAAVAVLATAANAADAPYYDKNVVVSPAPVSVTDWTGMYVGVFGGYGGGDFEYPFSVGSPALLSGQVDMSAGGFVGGAQIGFDWQASDAFVVGVVADIAWSDISDEVSVSLAAATDPITRVNGSLGTDLNYFGTIRARAGWLVTPDALLYVTGGAAYGETESALSLSASGAVDGSFGASTSDTDWGWTVGAGMEYRITENVSFETEYLYVDLGSKTLYSGDVFDLPARLDLDTSFHVVRAGVNFKFNMF
ncbi:outer membrane protein [Lutibaculum baratangense]|uniref:Outer membrane protein beta-barrel domain-containing protein n=1 Tax=Lutibaculum baratangense AMV1 TaxID=631454 RepID=V4R2M2_9HYPH|nr:outer membrane beta-barrel protein [Lutibaculum baratangense]ESR26202.1 hypothetical protein N177_1061 [Lutibaculum baratangense AMV1]